MSARGGQNRAHLIHVVRLDRIYLHSRRPSKSRDVASDVTAPMRLAQRRANRPVHLMCPARTTAIGNDLAVQPLQVLRLQAVEPLLPEPGDQMPPNRNAICRVAGLPNVRPGDVLQPVIQPFGDGPPLTGSPHLPLVARPLQVADPSEPRHPWSWP